MKNTSLLPRFLFHFEEKHKSIFKLIFTLLSFNASCWLGAQGSATFGSASSSGTFMFTVPVGVTSITASVWGAGGAGASAGNTRPGAGGGGFSQGILTVLPGQVLSLSVGKGAASPTGSASGLPGGNSTISSITANGGGGSTGSNAIGMGGTASGGTINNTGGNGGQRFSSMSTGGGGGQGACLAGNGTNGQTVTLAMAPGAGGTGGVCGSASAGGNGAPSTGGSGAPGVFPGGGGGGNRNSQGGAGANGQVILEWTCPDAGTISGANTICTIGDSITLTTDGTTGGAWSSNNTSAATVSSTGVVKSTGIGMATITYQFPANNGCPLSSATFAINSASGGVSYNGNCYTNVANALLTSPPSGAMIFITSNLMENNILAIPTGVTVTINTGITYTNSGSITNNGLITNNGTFNNAGLYKGTGNFNGAFNNIGTVAPGNSIIPVARY